MLSSCCFGAFDVWWGHPGRLSLMVVVDGMERDWVPCKYRLSANSRIFLSIVLVQWIVVTSPNCPVNFNPLYGQSRTEWVDANRVLAAALATTRRMATDKASSGSGSTSNLAFTLVAEDPDAMATSQDLRAALEKGTDDVKLETLRRIIISTLNGQPHVCRFSYL